MTDTKLIAGLSKLGFPMLEPNETLDINEILTEVVKSHDTRLWEGFPVLLANAVERYFFAPEKVEERLKSKKHKDHFHHLILFSGALFSLYHLSFSWWNRLSGRLSKTDKTMVTAWKNDLIRNQPLHWHDTEIDSERAKKLFELYFEQKAEKDRRRKEKFEELSLEHALSQVFSPKQKELFKKKLEGLPLNKTEQEYYSRTVKKKVVALANGDLHSLAKKLLGF